MNNYNFSTYYKSYFTKSVKWIIIINIIVFLAILIFKHVNWFYIFGLVPTSIIHRFAIWQLLTYMFLHGGFWHLLINMLMLWFFGCNLERNWGRREFLKFYFLTGVGAGICSVLTSPTSSIPIVGASGAIFGILVAYAMIFPETIVLLFFVFPVKIKHAVFIFGAINLFGALTNPGGEIAYLAHIGGGLTGYLYLKRETILDGIKNIFYHITERYRHRKKIKDEQLDMRVDEILEKISKEGIHSLTSQEKKILKQKSKDLIEK